ncbi:MULTISPECIES: ribosome silencing factor [Alteromonadaceae]|uniref:Ribosomal silencing factor RsfS n=1 Tax=Brumicola blandensis TaxID=3075611 RepID=A0AAW8QZ35_9ALTE|nr:MULTISPECIES: ribosome silencing factor [unclassified Alteromonas]MDT0581779.1 ribosome silencing factor [Alteromonas sp. W409]MDT0629830.1 ribosome silencing factor [Alteromonas sp. W364]
MNQSEIVKFVVDKLDDMKARDIIEINVEDKSTITDMLIVCSGNSKRHVSSIAENLVVEMKAAEMPPLSVEGKESGEWVLVDLGDVVVHVMQDETRDFYQLEKLWQ